MGGTPLYTHVDIRLPLTWDAAAMLAGLDDALYGCPMIDHEVDEEHWFVRAQGEANYGLASSRLEEVFDWCHAAGVPYIAHDESDGCECIGEIRIFDGSEVISGHYDQGPVLRMGTYDQIVAGLHVQWSSIDDYFARLDIDITELTLEHVVDEPPPFPVPPIKEDGLMPRYKLTGNYGTFEVSKIVEAADEVEALCETGIMSTLVDAGWHMTTPDGEEWEIEEVTE